jgi:hypothetical protein
MMQKNDCFHVICVARNAYLDAVQQLTVRFMFTSHRRRSCYDDREKPNDGFWLRSEYSRQDQRINKAKGSRRKPFCPA